MKVIDLIERLLKPVALIALVCVVGTFGAAYFSGESPLPIWLLRQLDLRREANIATWFQSGLFLLCGLSFALLGWKRDNGTEIPTRLRYVLLVAALACCFASADEAATLHERLGIRLEKGTGILDRTPIERSGYSWVLLYAPVVLTGLAVTTYGLHRVILKMPGPEGNRRRARAFLLTAVVGIPGVLLLEALEGGCQYYGYWVPVLPCLEETLEIIVLLGFIGSNSLIAGSYEL